VAPQPTHISFRNRENVDPELRKVAVRTAFIARFIVLREGRRSRAHRVIEDLSWPETTSAPELAAMIREAFVKNGDKLQPVDRDLNRALAHAERSADYFLDNYITRATTSFRDALADYGRSNQLLFGGEGEVPRKGGWRIPHNNGSNGFRPETD
jgi:hypothetical protein